MRAAVRITSVLRARIAVVTAGRALALTRIPNQIFVAGALVGVERRRAIVRKVGNLVSVLVLERVDHQTRPTQQPRRAVGAGTQRTHRAVGLGSAHPVLALAGTGVAELA